jgi:hypothetical protein
MRLCQIIELVPVHIHAARGDLVQQRLPHVSPSLIDQRYLGNAAPHEAVSEARGKLQAACASTDDYDAMRIGQGSRNED